MYDLSSVAFEAARAGASAITEALASSPLVLEDKGSNGQDLVTNADHASESAILELIRRHRPGDGFLAEESGEVRGTSGVRWVIDPLDGTTNVAHGGAYYAVSVAAEADARVIAAVVYQPGLGVWLGWGPAGLTSSSGQATGVTSCRTPSRALLSFAVLYEAGHRRAAYRILSEVAPQVGDLRNLGSTACDLSAVASGALDGFIGFGQATWDMAAGLTLVEAAGGVSHNVYGRDGLEIIIAGNPDVVATLAYLIRDHLDPG